MASPIDEDELKLRKKRQDVYEQYRKNAEEAEAADNAKKKEEADAKKGKLGSNIVKPLKQPQSHIGNLFKTQHPNSDSKK